MQHEGFPARCWTEWKDVLGGLGFGDQVLGSRVSGFRGLGSGAHVRSARAGAC